MRAIHYAIFIICALTLSQCKSSKSSSSRTPVKKTTKTASSSLSKKYAQIMGVEPSRVTNAKLYGFIDDWYGSPYKFGGQSKGGVDCSGFVQTLFTSVYAKSIPRTTKEIRAKMKAVPTSRLEEGNLIFFDINGKKGSHVGVYLMNGHFVHASTSKGVIISNLSNPYYKKAMGKAGKY